jgi:predicted DNA-binding ribbon-helix-helix protein
LVFSIEVHFWVCFEEIARSLATTTDQLAQWIVADQTNDHLPSAIRTYVLKYFKNQSQPFGDIDQIRAPTASMATSDIFVEGAPPRWLN